MYLIDQEKYQKAYERAVYALEKWYTDNMDSADLRSILADKYKTERMDSDAEASRVVNGIKCTADGLISIKKICEMESEESNIISVYRECRKYPVMYFPSEVGGINTTRYIVFGDRIDHTLYDLKMYYLYGADYCMLRKAYSRPKTHAWLKEMGSFEDIIDWYGIKGIFTDEFYDVYDLESNVDIITEYKSRDNYKKQWGIQYYENLKLKINEFVLCCK